MKVFRIILLVSSLFLPFANSAQEIDWDVLIKEGGSHKVKKEGSIRLVNYSDSIHIFYKNFAGDTVYQTPKDNIISINEKLIEAAGTKKQIQLISSDLNSGDQLSMIGLELISNKDNGQTQFKEIPSDNRIANTSVIEDVLLIREFKISYPGIVEKILNKKYNLQSKTDIGKNDFLKEALSDFKYPGRQTSKGVFQKLSKQLGGLDVTNFSDGLAKFLVNRVKEELSINFFQEFSDKVKEQEELKHLFPGTTQGLLQIGDDIYNLQRYINMLREQFESDLKLLPQNLDKFIEKDSLKLFEGRPDEKIIFRSGLAIVKGFMDEDHPGEIVKSLAALLSTYTPDQTSGRTEKDILYLNIANSLATLSVISESLKETREERNNQYWVDKETINKVINDPIAFQIYIGLLSQKFKENNIKLYTKNTSVNGEELSEILNNSVGKIQTLLTHFQPLTAEVNTLNTLLKSDADPKQKFSFIELSRYFNAINGLLESTSDIIQTLTDSSYLTTLVGTSKRVSSLYSNIVNQRYQAGALDLIDLYEFHLLNRIKAQKPAPDSEKLDKLEAQLKIIQTYTPFMASLLLAENSDDMSAAIEAFALPSGSARIKRVSNSNISLNAYVGPFAGSDFSKYQIENAKAIAGLSSPVGVAFSWGKKGMNNDPDGAYLIKNTKSTNYKSNSLFFSLIDIGPITYFRFQNSNDQVAKVYLREIFAPGVFYSRGLGKGPYSINLGVQYSPLLVNVGSNSNEVQTQRNLRVNLSFALDLPILNFYTRSEKEKPENSNLVKDLNQEKLEKEVEEAKRKFKKEKKNYRDKRKKLTTYKVSNLNNS